MKLLTVQQYAKEYKKCEQWIRKLCKSGKLKAKKFGKMWMIEVEE